MKQKIQKLKKLKPVFQRNSIDRTTRMYAMLRPHIRYIKKKCSKKVQAVVLKKKDDLKRIRKRVKWLKITRIICFIMLYVSLFGALFGNFIILREAVMLATVISGILGTTILLIIISILSRAIDIHVSEAHMIASFIIATSVKHGNTEFENPEF